MRPFGCPVTILNTKDYLGKFDGKADEGFFIGYSLICKAFRVFNNRPRIVEENLHVRFRNQSNGNASIKACNDGGKARMEIVPNKDYILLPLWTTDPLISLESRSSQDCGFQPSSDNGKKVDEDLRQESECKYQEKEENVNITNNVNATSTNGVNIVGAKTNNELPFDLMLSALEDISTFNFSSDHEDADEYADMNNMDTTIQVSPTPTTRIHKDHPLDQVIHALKDPSWIEATHEEHLQFKLQEVWTLVDLPYGKRAIGTKWVFQNKKDERGFKDLDFLDKVYKVEKALYGLHQAHRAWYETLSTYLLDNGFHRGKIDKTLFIRRHKDDILLVQVYVDDIIFGLTKKELCDAFEKMMHEKFQMSSMRELTFFIGLQVKQKKSVKLVRIKTEREMCKNKKSDLVRKRNERIGITYYCWVDVNAVNGFEQIVDFLNVNPIKEGQLQALADGKKIIITGSTIRRYLQLEDVEGVDCLPNAVIFELLALMGTMASAIIYLSTNQKFNFSKYIFETMVKNLDNVNKFLMYP
nr:retrotransposon protein, putative, Ty1-copia subclass [Tanacetum cinerariifolium]